MNAKKGLTKIDLVVALACVVFVLINVPVIIAGGRGRAKLEVCMANLRALADAWQMQANDNDGKIASGDVWYSWVFPANVAGGPQLAWVEWPHPSPHLMPPNVTTNCTSAFTCYPNPCSQAAWQHSILEGKLGKYIGDLRVYRCPVGAKNQYVTYAMSHSMNTYPGSAGTNAPMLTNINQIIRPEERFVFLDVGSAKKGAFFVSYSGSGSTSPGRWYDPPPMRHNQGTTFVLPMDIPNTGNGPILIFSQLRICLGVAGLLIIVIVIYAGLQKPPGVMSRMFASTPTKIARIERFFDF
jgi:hypothetical protein